MLIAKLARKIFVDKRLVQDIEFFGRVSLFEGLPDRSLAELINISNTKSYGPGEVVFEERSAGRILYIVRSGTVSLTKGGREISRLSAGSSFGDKALLEEAPRSFTATAAGRCELILIYRVKFEGFLSHDPAAGVTILRHLAISCSRDEPYAG